jgi:hypothetical protein
MERDAVQMPCKEQGTNFHAMCINKSSVIEWKQKNFLKKYTFQNQIILNGLRSNVETLFLVANEAVTCQYSWK